MTFDARIARDHNQRCNDAPARIRAAVTALNDGLGEKSEDVRLLATELVTNAVVHAGAAGMKSRASERNSSKEL
jgi:anti-sigma regulatory factor (Ser/Thr protein kinase)